MPKLNSTNSITDPHLISVIIPCYNHGRFLSTAIESVLNQAHVKTEVIVVDDGSTDDTPEVAKRFPGVKYIYQKNSGISATRNTGIAKSTGNYLVFLDADDWLMPDALATQYSYFNNNKNLQAVSGAFVVYDENLQTEKVVKRDGQAFSYIDLLYKNYIGMLSSVMFSRSVFNRISYDKELKYCEDWDIYLHITRMVPVLHHTTPIAVYRRYGSSMSYNISNMFVSGLQVLNRQHAKVVNAKEHKALRKGIRRWQKIYTLKMYLRLLDLLQQDRADAEMLHLLWDNNKVRYFKYQLRKIIKAIYAILSLNNGYKLEKQY